MKNKALEEL
jgi:hypothetical protein